MPQPSLECFNLYRPCIYYQFDQIFSPVILKSNGVLELESGSVVECLLLTQRIQSFVARTHVKWLPTTSNPSSQIWHSLLSSSSIHMWHTLSNRHRIHIYTWLKKISQVLCGSLDWPQTLGHPPVSASQTGGLQAWSTIPRVKCFVQLLFCFKTETYNHSGKHT